MNQINKLLISIINNSEPRLTSNYTFDIHHVKTGIVQLTYTEHDITNVFCIYYCLLVPRKKVIITTITKYTIHQ